MKPYYEFIVCRFGEDIREEFYLSEVDCLFDLCKHLKEDKEAYWGKMYFVSENERKEIICLDGLYNEKRQKNKMKRLE